jgi:hypothetical protein
MKNKLPLLFLVFFICLVGVNLYLFAKLQSVKKDGGNTSSDQTTTNRVLDYKINDPNLPVRRTANKDDKAVFYKVFGRFEGEPKLNENNQGIYGRFYLEGDTPINSFNVLLTTASDEIMMGIYGDSFGTESTWNVVKTTEVFNKINSGNLLQLRSSANLVNSVDAEQITKVDGIFESLTTNLLGDGIGILQ